MTERIFERLDRLGAEAGITEMTPALRRFALLVRKDMLSQWVMPVSAQPAQEWPPLTDAQRRSYQKGHDAGVAHHKQAIGERNFCHRCGKRLQGVLGQPQSHTCTPPLWGHT